ncbi:phage major capsid protein [Streptomyces violaceusniger]|uniref:Phage major capsid protein, HK97 family n=1 Tax=Streptomyces violaceusniger (strain Tu 4113) TaxID=653045 RepID=G2P7C3_STRV4|nr:phage major capsid protein [Streptomyces violaceusniger]AEM87083.1 phage major capsid protein, HK97 family [Streptomyces violaceusniger Tu 4113]
MSNVVKRLQERRANVWEQAKALLDKAEGENRDLTAEEETTYQKLNGDLDAIDARVKDMVEAEQRSKDADAAFAALLDRPAGARQQPREEDSELRRFARGELRSIDIRPEGPVNFRDLVKGTATAGGNTVPTTFYGQLVAHLIEVSGVLMANPTVLNTASGESMEVPVTTAHSTAAITSEGGTITESDPAFAKRTLGAYKYGVLIQASSELLTDTGVDLEGYLSMQAGRALGNALGAHLVTGDGSSKPTGVVTSASTGKTGGTGVVGAFTADDLIDLFYSVIAPYRNSPACGWMMRDATMGAARKLKDGQGQYLWQPSLQLGVPDTLLGKPVYTDPNVAAVATSAKSVVFGDFSAYFVRMAGGVRFERSDDFAFNSDLTTFRAIIRADGLTVDQTGALKVFAGAGT